jgi:hypothetical protein
MIAAIPDRPPTWMRALAVVSALLGGSFSAMMLSVNIHDSSAVVYLLLVMVAAFIPLILLQRFRSVWARGICYPIGGLLALVIIFATIGGILSPA